MTEPHPVPATERALDEALATIRRLEARLADAVSQCPIQNATPPESRFSPRCLQVPQDYPDGPRSYQWRLRVMWPGGSDEHAPVPPYEGATASQIHAALAALMGAVTPPDTQPDTQRAHEDGGGPDL